MLLIQRKVKGMAKTNKSLYFLSMCYDPITLGISKENPYDYQEALFDHNVLCRQYGPMMHCKCTRNFVGNKMNNLINLLLLMVKPYAHILST